MYEGDRSRKQTLVNYGFRLPSALDNRPLKFEEFEHRVNYVIYVSATPGDYEIENLRGELLNRLYDQQDLLIQRLRFVRQLLRLRICLRKFKTG